MISAKQHIEDSFSRIEYLVTKCESTLVPLNDAQFNWKKDDKTWSIAQNLHHIILVNSSYIDECRNVFHQNETITTKNLSPYRTDYNGNMMFHFVDPRNTLKSKTIAEFIPSNDTFKNSFKMEFCKNLKKLQSFLEEVSGYDFNETKIQTPNNKFINVNLGDMIKIIIDHTERHYNQILATVNSVGFPKS